MCYLNCHVTFPFTFFNELACTRKCYKNYTFLRKETKIQHGCIQLNIFQNKFSEKRKNAINEISCELWMETISISLKVKKRMSGYSSFFNYLVSREWGLNVCLCIRVSKLVIRVHSHTKKSTEMLFSLFVFQNATTGMHPFVKYLYSTLAN